MSTGFSCLPGDYRPSHRPGPADRRRTARPAILPVALAIRVTSANADDDAAGHYRIRNVDRWPVSCGADDILFLAEYGSSRPRRLVTLSGYGFPQGHRHRR